jgi:L-seryl-tRNA(Ser) seleniumtransferase
MNPLLRGLPAVDRLADALGGDDRALTVGAARQALDDARHALLAGADAVPDLVADARRHLEALTGRRLRRVINASGVVIHTNLGRAAWSPAAREAAAEAMGYAAVELDLDSGRRGGRLDGVRGLLRHLCGAPSALVVNNCAAAVLLTLTSLARGREVIVSRGELVEIGGSFRVPDVIASGGARLVEVGTTNRTRAADYAAAVTPHTALLLRVHPSNFRVVGFTESPDRRALAALARERGVPLVEDLGAGSLAGELGEPSVREVLAQGVDLVMFSGDKLLGGPQAGLVAGRADLIDTLRAHPLYRALRVDKVSLAALEATLADHAAGRPTPTTQRVHADPSALRARAERWCAVLGGALTPHDGAVGGGALPGQALPGWACRLQHPEPLAWARALRMGRPAVVARVHDGAVWLDPRCVDDDDDALLLRLVAEASPPR